MYGALESEEKGNGYEELGWGRKRWNVKNYKERWIEWKGIDGKELTDRREKRYMRRIAS